MDIEKKIKYGNIFIKIFVILVLLLAIFYWAMGDQLYYRESAGTVDEGMGNILTPELVDGTCLEETFYADMDRLDSVGVLLSSGEKSVDCTIKLSLIDLTTEETLLEGTIEGKEVGLNTYHYISSDKGISNIRNHQMLLSVTAAGATEGNAIVSIYDNTNTADGTTMYINHEKVDGTLCYSLNGSDKVWAGKVYPQIALCIIILCSTFYLMCVYLHKKGKKEPIFKTYFMIKKYSFLIEQIVSRDFKVKYKRSLLGVFWSLLNPLLTMLVQYMIFSQLFKQDIENYPIYLLSGTVIFSFFSEGVSLALGAIIENATLITKVYVPKYIYPVTRVLSSLINLLLSLIPLFIGVLITGEAICKAYLLIPVILFCVLIFTMGFGMLLSALMVFFRDIRFLWGVLSMLWMYVTPLFYPANIVPDEWKFAQTYNPMFYYVSGFRNIILDGVSPEPKMYVLYVIMAAASLLIGSFVFKKTQDKFALNI